MNKSLSFKLLDLPQLIATARTLSPIGRLVTTADKWTYLDIDDAYIHQLFPLLEDHYQQLYKPEYFSNHLAGAHITVIYPEENKFIDNNDLGKQHQFSIIGSYSADLNLKRYYVLAIKSASLTALRKKYGLGHRLSFKNHLVKLHITIGTAPLTKDVT